jgi:hypothetical protein
MQEAKAPPLFAAASWYPLPPVLRPRPSSPCRREEVAGAGRREGPLLFDRPVPPAGMDPRVILCIKARNQDKRTVRNSERKRPPPPPPPSGAKWKNNDRARCSPYGRARARVAQPNAERSVLEAWQIGSQAKIVR